MKETIVRAVTLRGLKDIMFDRYAGDNNTKLDVHQKLYLRSDGEPNPIIGIPALNVMSFLTAHNTESAPKRLRDPRKYKALCNAILSFTDIEEDFLPLLRDGAPIRFGQFDGDRDPLSGTYIHRSVARLDKGVPNPKVRPVVPLPWAVSFHLTLYPNSEVREEEIMNLLVEGGRALGLGTYRKLFGKFEVDSWV